MINATTGRISVDALKLAGADKVGAKVLIDTANELDFSKGMPPRALASQDNCLAEQIQAAFPNLKVVKSLNTVGAPVMVDPAGAEGRRPHHLRRGNDGPPRRTVAELLGAFGWTDMLDLGESSSARGPEMYMAMWLRLWGATGTGVDQHQSRALTGAMAEEGAGDGLVQAGSTFERALCGAAARCVG